MTRLLRNTLKKQEPKQKKPRKDDEYKLHKAICDFTRLQYPDVEFNSGMEGMNLTKVQAGKMKVLRSSKGFPDLEIYEARGGCFGLFMEIKIENPYRQDGKLKAGDHLKNQAEKLSRLNDRGYKALFIWDLDDAITVIREYMKSTPTSSS